MRCSAHRFVFFVGLCCCGLLLALASVAPARAVSRTPTAASTLQISAAPLNPAFLESLVSLPIGVPSGAAVGQPLGSRPGPQDFSHTAGMQVPGVRALALPATYDLRTAGGVSRVTSVKSQNPYGTCWSFAACGSLESGLMPGENLDFSEDNMVLTSGFNFPGTLYDAGGQIWMSTAYLARWGGPVYESDDAYGDNNTPPGLTPRKHVQEVHWIPSRGSALDNTNIKTAVMQFGAADVSMGWYGSSSGSSYYNATTKSYYYDGSSGTNHEVLIVGWDDDYAAANFATTPPGNGAFLVKNSWGTGWGNSGYFWASYYDTEFGLGDNPFAVFNNAESTSNYSGIYQYDPLGYVTDLGYTSSTTAWFANVFTANATASLDAVGFYTAVPGASYEVYTGASLATKTLSTSGTIAYMGYHTVSLPSPVGVTNGQPFVVAVKMTTPGYNYPIPVEYQVANYSSAATAAAGQSYVSSTGTSWSDITTAWNATANVCLKAYVKPSVAPAPTLTVTAPTGSGSYAVGASLTVNWSSNMALASGEFAVWARSSGGAWYGGTLMAASGGTSFSNSLTLSVPAGSGYQAIVSWRPTVGTGAWVSFATQTGSFAVTAANPTLTVTAPTGSGSYAVGASLTVNWSSNMALASGEFAVWARSSGGAWYGGTLMAASGGTSFSNSLTLSVPAGSGYQAIVSWRPTVGTGAWVSFATQTGSFAVTAANPTLTVTAPTGSGSYAVGASLTVNWSSNMALASGEFAVWARSSGGAWYGGTLMAASGGTSFSNSLTLSVPAGSGYQAIVSWRPTVGTGAWVSFATQTGSFAVTAANPTLTVTAPTGSGSYAVGASLTVNWSSNMALASGEFAVWARSSGGAWYGGTLMAASGGTSFSNSLTLSVPAGSGYQAIVSWRPTVGTGAWVSFATQTGSFAVTAANPTLTVTAPTGSGSYAVGASLTVNWSSNMALASGEFAVWARSSGGAWYGGTLMAASGGTSFSNSLTLSVPAGSGYQAIVSWRPTVGTGAWVSFATQTGSFAVTAP